MADEEEEQRIKKRKKYLRDIEDYKFQNVFKWQEIEENHTHQSEIVSMEGQEMLQRVPVLPSSFSCPPEP